ncbi:FG-GAP repeat domain-containing protein [Streptomyces sp. NPDC055897]
MARISSRKSGTSFSRLAVATMACALLGVSAGAASADSVYWGHQPATTKHGPTARNFAAAAATPTNAANPVFPLIGVDKANLVWVYGPNGAGGLTPREATDGTFPALANDAFVDNDADGYLDGEWQWSTGGNLDFYANSNVPKPISGGWNIYDKVLAPGNLGGAPGYDIVARDKTGVLWLYLGYGDGTVTSRIKVGGGWNVYTQLAGKGDLDGDGRADIVARDTAGVLWFYKGTGNYKAPFAPRTRIGSGWNMFDALVSSGDVDLDGKTDLIAREPGGNLWLYKGTGNAAAPYRTRVQIGWSYNIYRLMAS